jgi:hypothetical protein
VYGYAVYEYAVHIHQDPASSWRCEYGVHTV